MFQTTNQSFISDFIVDLPIKKIVILQNHL